jgi:Lrp/AsnC family transcriptional regulator
VSGFARLIEGHAEIVECLATSGSADYQMKIRIADVEAYEQFMSQVLLRSPHVREVHSSFVLKELKSTTEIPV